MAQINAEVNQQEIDQRKSAKSAGVFLSRFGNYFPADGADVRRSKSAETNPRKSAESAGDFFVFTQ